MALKNYPKKKKQKFIKNYVMVSKTIRLSVIQTQQTSLWAIYMIIIIINYNDDDDDLVVVMINKKNEKEKKKIKHHN